MKDQFYAYIENLQDEICAALEKVDGKATFQQDLWDCLLYTSPSPRDGATSRMPSSA